MENLKLSHHHLTARALLGTLLATSAVLVGSLTVLATQSASARPLAANAKEQKFQQGAFLNAVSCTSKTDCTSVGYHQASSGTTAPLGEIWNGSHWRSVGIELPKRGADFVMSGVSCPSSGSCEAVSNYYLSRRGSTKVLLAARWAGGAWGLQQVPLPPAAVSGSLSSISCPSSSWCEAVGTAEATRGTATLAAVWNGKSWRAQSVPVVVGGADPSLSGVSCTSASFCEAVGQFASMLTGREAPLAERWDGRGWLVQPGASSGATGLSGLRSVSCTSPTDCEAVGYSTDGGLAEVWNGHFWSRQQGPNGVKGSTLGVLTGVSCPTSGLCEAVGYDLGSSGAGVAVAATSSGSAWKAQGLPKLGGGQPVDLNGVSCASTSFCQAVGQYGSTSSGSHPLVLAWNGSAWKGQSAPAS